MQSTKDSHVLCNLGLTAMTVSALSCPATQEEERERRRMEDLMKQDEEKGRKRAEGGWVGG
jgi:hypothetical protein